MSTHYLLNDGLNLIQREISNLNIASYSIDTNSLSEKKYPQVCELQILEKNYYKVGSVLGRGGYGIVYRGIRISDYTMVAIKHIAKNRVVNWDNLDGQKLPLEICLLRKVAHISGVVKLIDFYEQPESFIIVMERPEFDKDLFDYITEKGCLDEYQAYHFFQQIVETVIQCHDSGVIHLDIKDENILVNVKTLSLKLVDFGSGNYLKDTPYTTFDANHVFSPPEWISNKCYYGNNATVWSLGLLLYNMIYGNIPFQQEEQILTAKLEFNPKHSVECQDLIKMCLHIKPAERIGLTEIPNHPWMTMGKQKFIEQTN